MDLEQRKKKFIEQFLKIENENLISQFENMLNSDDQELNSFNLSFKILDLKNMNQESQIEYLENLEISDDVLLKWSLFRSVLEDSTFSDLVRIEVLSIIGSSDVPEESRSHFIEIILKYLEGNTESDIFLHNCIVALHNQDLYSQKVYDKMLVIFMDKTAKTEIRLNADTIISNNTKGEELKIYYEKFIENSDSVFLEFSKIWVDKIVLR